MFKIKMKKLFLFLLISVFFLSFSSAETGYELNEEVNITITCLNDGYCSSASYCNINIEDPNGDIIIMNTNMTYTVSFHYYTLNITELGAYKITGFCQDGTSNKQVDFLFGGDEGEVLEIVAGVLLVLLIIGLMLSINMKYKGVDFDKWNDNIKESHNNTGKTFVKGIFYGLMKNVFIWYYFLGWIMLFIIKEIVVMFNSAEILGYFLLMLDIYSLGFILVMILLIGYFVGYMRNMVDDLTNESWGIT